MSDLAEVIARWRDRLRCVPDHEVIDLEVTGQDANALLDAAEAGVRARDAALEEAAQIVDDMVHPDNKETPAYAVCLGAARRIRALRGAA